MDLATKYPGASEEAIDLLNQMLQFNPFFRISVDKALEHPFFTKVRKPHKEVNSDTLVDLEFELEGDLEVPRLRMLFGE